MFRTTSIILSSVLLSPISSFSPPSFVTTTRNTLLVNSVSNDVNFKFPRLFTAYYDDFDEEDDEEDDEDEEEEYPYLEANPSEFSDGDSSGGGQLTTSRDWGGALGKLRERIEDQESGLSKKPSNALFNTMISETPNEAIGKFVQSADPTVVAAMTGAVSSLLGGLTNPAMGVETIVKSSGEKMGNLCFQLQMTGYMFRNAEYVLAVKDLMKIRTMGATRKDYKEAFDRIDSNGSGYIESSEIEDLLRDVYDDEKGPPAFEIETFMQFFDSNKDGRISWNEFERGLGAAAMADEESESSNNINSQLLLPEYDDEDDDYTMDGVLSAEPNISGKIEVELKDGKVIEVEAKDYIRDLKREAETLKEALRRENGQPQQGSQGGSLSSVMPPSSNQDANAAEQGGGIASYIASLGGDVKTLTEGISPDVVDAMRMLVDYVIEGGPASKNNKNNKNNKNKGNRKDEIEMEIPGTSLQQLALWQLVLGYRLRESEATGDYLKLLE